MLLRCFIMHCYHHVLCEIVRHKKIKSRSEIGDFLIPPLCDVIDARQPVFTAVGQLKRKSEKAQWREELKWQCKVPNTDLTQRQIDRRLLERREEEQNTSHAERGH